MPKPANVDTVGLSIMAGQRPQALDRLPWEDRIRYDERDQLSSVVFGLSLAFIIWRPQRMRKPPALRGDRIVMARRGRCPLDKATCPSATGACSRRSIRRETASSPGLR